MIFAPLAGKPIVTQGFGQRPDFYSQFGLAGHNGIDFGVDEGTPVYAPHDGIATVKDEGEEGYGLHVIVQDDNRLSFVAHLSESLLSDGQRIYQGDPIAKSGNSGISTNPHLHWTYKILNNGVVQNSDNGYDGAVDVTEFTRLWLDEDLHNDSDYTDFAREYLAMNFPDNVYLKNPNRNIA